MRQLPNETFDNLLSRLQEAVQSCDCNVSYNVCKLENKTLFQLFLHGIQLAVPIDNSHTYQHYKTAYLLQNVRLTPIISHGMHLWTSSNPLLSVVKLVLQKEWLRISTPERQPYFTHYHKLSLQDGCILGQPRCGAV